MEIDENSWHEKEEGKTGMTGRNDRNDWNGGLCVTLPLINQLDTSGEPPLMQNCWQNRVRLGQTDVEFGPKLVELDLDTWKSHL